MIKEEVIKTLNKFLASEKFISSTPKNFLGDIDGKKSKSILLILRRRYS